MRVKMTIVIAAALVAGVAIGKQIPPATRHLGPVVPTPVPSPEVRERIRMIASFTLQNRPDGDSIISFEATDFGKTPKGDYRILASQQYSLLEAKKAARPLAGEIMRDIRDLEERLLEFVEIQGPPRVRAPITDMQAPPRP
jgi:hypothetical protein